MCGTFLDCRHSGMSNSQTHFLILLLPKGLFFLSLPPCPPADDTLVATGTVLKVSQKIAWGLVISLGNKDISYYIIKSVLYDFTEGEMFKNTVLQLFQSGGPVLSLEVRKNQVFGTHVPGVPWKILKCDRKFRYTFSIWLIYLRFVIYSR